MRLPLAAFYLILATAPSLASSNEAQAEFTLEVAKVCATSSGLEQAHVSQIIEFDDTLNMVATLVTGIYPQPFMKGATGKVLCIYDKQTKQTWLDDAAGWSAPDLQQQRVTSPARP